MDFKAMDKACLLLRPENVRPLISDAPVNRANTGGTWSAPHVGLLQIAALRVEDGGKELRLKNQPGQS